MPKENSSKISVYLQIYQANCKFLFAELQNALI